jgi:hypothetical protein
MHYYFIVSHMIVSFKIGLVIQDPRKVTSFHQNMPHEFRNVLKCFLKGLRELLLLTFIIRAFFIKAIFRS